MQTISTGYEIISAPSSQLGEGPVWDSTSGKIYWVDILGKKIHQYSATSGHRETLVSDFVGAIALWRDNKLLAAIKGGLAIVDVDTGIGQRLTNPEPNKPANRFNDGKCDPAGRFWIGTMALSEEEKAGALYVVDQNLKHSLKIDGVSISNGLAWSAAGKYFYYIDTPTLEVARYDFDPESATISNRTVAIRIRKEEGFPDGMTIDAEGMLWIAHWDGWQVARWNPTTGKKMLSLKLPVARVTCCTFGGSSLQDLYVTTAKKGLTEKELGEQPHAGKLFVFRACGFTGMETQRFKLNPEKLNA